ncbi:MAG: hypothetical protein AB7V55_00340 [Oscillospiraceae bacterium]
MLLGELAGALDPKLVLELYGLEDNRTHHKGTFYLDDEASRAQLVRCHGKATVRHRDLYKAYAMVYIDG